MKQAKQQQQDLRQTDDFLIGLMKPGGVEKEKQKHSSSDSSSSRQVNGRPKMPRMDSFSRFSDPPAPPPQQPLPEKPDALPRNGVDAISPLKRTDTEKPKMSAGSSPVSRESSQILSLIEALTSAKRELDTQGARVKELENMLLQERHARESAEEKAKSLELESAKEHQDLSTASPHELQLDGSPSPDKEKRIKKSDVDAENGPVEPEQNHVPVDDQAEKLQRRLDTVMEDMEAMRKQLFSYKERAEKAEQHNGEVRKSLAEMIETIQQERVVSGSSSTQPTKCLDSASPDVDPNTHSDASMQGAILPPRDKDAASTGTPNTALSHKRLDAVEQSSPFASMLGVVLLGVGLMAYLNKLQNVDR